MQRASRLLRSKFAVATCVKRWLISCPFDFKKFVSHKEIEGYLSSLGGRTLGCSNQGRNILGIRIGDGPVCVLEAGTHAREWASPMAALYVVNKLVNEPPAGVAWLVIPLLNPDGYEFSRKGNPSRMWRKNMSKTKSPWCLGVDINRNFSIDWGNAAGCWHDPCMDTYCGKCPWSEPESVAVKHALLLERDVRAYLSVHSCLQSIMYPPAHTTDKPVDLADLVEVAQGIQTAIQHKYGVKYEIGQSSVLDRKASGSSIDWARQEIGIKYAYNFELRGPEVGFLLPASDIEQAGKDLYEAVNVVTLAARTFDNSVKPNFINK